MSHIFVFALHECEWKVSCILLSEIIRQVCCKLSNKNPKSFRYAQSVMFDFIGFMFWSFVEVGIFCCWLIFYCFCMFLITVSEIQFIQLFVKQITFVHSISLLKLIIPFSLFSNRLLLQGCYEKQPSLISTIQHSFPTMQIFLFIMKLIIKLCLTVITLFL